MGVGVMKFKNDKELFNLMEKKLYTAAISDVMDDLGFRNQAMRHDIRPLEMDYIIAGRAKTILTVDVYDIPDNPYKMEIESIDSIKEDEVVVACTNQSSRNGFWGELLSTASKARGARGAVIDGITRDVKKIIKLGFPVFATGVKPVDSKGRGIVIKYDCPIKCGGVVVNPGDIIFADYDGIVVIPQKIIDKVIPATVDKVERENKSREELMNGAFLRDVYDKYGAL